MESQTEIITAQLEDGTTVKVKASALGGDEDVVDLEKILPFREVTDAIESIAGAMVTTLKKINPDKARVEFGVEVAIESGALTALLVQGTGSGNLKITLEWGK